MGPQNVLTSLRQLVFAFSRSAAPAAAGLLSGSRRSMTMAVMTVSSSRSGSGALIAAAAGSACAGLYQIIQSRDLKNQGSWRVGVVTAAAEAESEPATIPPDGRGPAPSSESLKVHELVQKLQRVFVDRLEAIAPELGLVNGQSQGRFEAVEWLRDGGWSAMNSGAGL